MPDDIFDTTVSLDETHFAEGLQQGMRYVVWLQRKGLSDNTAYINVAGMACRQAWWRVMSWDCRKGGRLVKRLASMQGVFR